MPLVAVFMVYFGIFGHIFQQIISKTIWQNQILDLTHVGH